MVIALCKIKAYRIEHLTNMYKYILLCRYKVDDRSYRNLNLVG